MAVPAATATVLDSFGVIRMGRPGPTHLVGTGRFGGGMMGGERDRKFGGDYSPPVGTPGTTTQTIPGLLGK